MSKADTFENALLLLIFNNTNIANLGDATGVRGSTTVGSVYLSLHTADPLDAGTQTTSEVNTTQYPNYARVAVARSTAGWTITGNSAALTAAVDFPASGAGTGAIITHFGVGLAASGAGNLLYKGAVTPNITIANGVTPRLNTGTAITED